MSVNQDKADELITDDLVAQARANRGGEVYPTPDRLIENLPIVLRALCDYTLSGQASALDIARTLASVIDVVENVQRNEQTRH